jgi:SAD/SRA domain
VSGNKNVGADSIIVSGLRPDGLGADNLLEHIYAASVKEGALALLRSAKDGKPVRVVRSNVLDSAYKATRNERRKSSSPQFYRYDGVYKITKVQYRDPRCGLRDYVDGVTGTPTTRVFLFRMERCGDGMGPSDNKIPNADYAQFCIDRGSMSHDALTALAQALPLEFQLSLNIFNQEFLGALSLLSLHPSTEVESLIYPGLQLLSNCAESMEVESLLCPGLQLLSNCAESTEVESLLCPGLQLLSNNRVTNRKRRHAALQEAALLEPIDGALNHASPVEAAQKRPAVLEPVINKAEPFHAARKVAFANFDMNESSFTTSAKAARCKGRPVNGKHHRAALQAPAFRKLRDRVLNHVLPLDIARKRPAMLEQAIAKADPLKVVRNASSTNSLINEGKKRRRLDLSANAPIQNEAAQGQDSSARRSPRFAMPLVNSTAAAKETVPDSCSAKQRHRPQEFAIGGKRTSPRLAKVVEIVRKAIPARKLQNVSSRRKRARTNF